MSNSRDGISADLPATSSSSMNPSRHPSHTENVIQLPTEIVILILSSLPHRAALQPTFYSACLVSRQWYPAAVPNLYHSPYITGKNFKAFVRTVCPSVNAHVRKSELAAMVRVLNMTRLVHDGSKSLTARLLGRLKPNLETFLAPQSSFGISCFAALSKCSHLQTLDLTCVAEAISVPELLRAIGSLKSLKSIQFPRSASRHDRALPDSFEWPPLLESMTFRGERIFWVLARQLNYPATVRHLSFYQVHPACVNVCGDTNKAFLTLLAPQLISLRILDPVERPSPSSFGHLLVGFPNLLRLSVPEVYVLEEFWLFTRPGHPLQMLELTQSASNLRFDDVERNLLPIRIREALLIGPLSRLRRICVSENLGWLKHDVVDNVRELVDQLDELGEKDEQERLAADDPTKHLPDPSVWVFPSDWLDSSVFFGAEVFSGLG